MEKKTMVKKRDVLLKIFVSTLYLSAFTFGGGYVIVKMCIRDRYIAIPYKNYKSKSGGAQLFS